MKAHECFFFQLAKASQKGSKLWGQRVLDLKITAVQAMILRFLFDEDDITSRTLGARTDLDSATLTGILDRLEAAGLIERNDNPLDRRSILIHLTEPGRGIGRELALRMVAANADFISALTPEEAFELRRILGKLRQHAPL